MGKSISNMSKYCPTFVPTAMILNTIIFLIDYVFIIFVIIVNFDFRTYSIQDSCILITSIRRLVFIFEEQIVKILYLVLIQSLSHDNLLSFLAYS